MIKQKMLSAATFIKLLLLMILTLYLFFYGATTKLQIETKTTINSHGTQQDIKNDNNISTEKNKLNQQANEDGIKYNSIVKIKEESVQFISPTINNTHLLVGVLSLPNHIHKRQCVRDTWKQYLGDWSLVFVIELPFGPKQQFENEIYGDIVLINKLKTNTDDLTVTKIAAIFELVIQPRWVMIVDDNTFINIPNVLKKLSSEINTAHVFLTTQQHELVQLTNVTSFLTYSSNKECLLSKFLHESSFPTDCKMEIFTMAEITNYSPEKPNNKEILIYYKVFTCYNMMQLWNCNTYPYRITPNNETFMYGYYDKHVVDDSNTKVLVGKIPFYNQEPRENDTKQIGWVSITGNRVFNFIAKTTAWNLQQGCMMEWIGRDKIIFNKRNEDAHTEFNAVTASLDGKTKIYKRPVYAWTEGKFLSISFARLHNMRRGYGYTVPLTEIQRHPTIDGIWLVDMETENELLLFSYDEIRKYLLSLGDTDYYTGNHYNAIPDGENFYWWVNHLMWGKDKQHFSFIARASTELHGHFYQFSTLMMADTITKTLWRVPGLRGSHPYFGKFLLNCENKGTFIIKFQESVTQLPWQRGKDGHCSWSPAEDWIVTDAYLKKNKMLLLEQTYGNKQLQLGEFTQQGEGPVYTRCDLHPRWSRDGAYILFDSTHENIRAVFMYPVLTIAPTYVYIDLGARNGDSITWFITQYPERQNAIIWAWEANPQNEQNIIMYIKQHPELKINLIKKAAWIHNNGVNFTLDNRRKLTGGSMFNNNQTYLHGAPMINIQSIDFSMWLLKYISPLHQVILKMDIEGSEYEIIDKMIQDRSISRFHTIIIEWHDRFMPGKNCKDYIKKLENVNKNVILWD